MIQPEQTIASRRLTGASRRVVLTALVLIATSACSGGDDAAESDEATSTSVAEATIEEEPATSSSDEPDDDTGTTTTTTASAPTTSVPPEPPRVAPAGERWVSTMIEPGLSGIGVPTVAVLDDSIWVVANRFNGAVAYRSTDGGDTWEDRSFVEAPQSATTHSISGIVRGATGRLVAHGSINSDCNGSESVDDGYRFVGVCRALRPVVHVSDDGGDSWTELSPAALQPSPGTSVVVNQIVATPTGYAAIGTVRGPDWHARVWDSADGAEWAVAAELRTPDAPSTGVALAVVENRAVAIVDANPCATPEFNNTPGWILGTQWADHGRIFDGPSLDQLALQTPADHPLAPEPASLDCAALDQFEVAGLPYPDLAVGATASGVVIARVGVPADEEPETPVDLELATLSADESAGAWTVSQASGVTAGDGLSGRLGQTTIVSTGGAGLVTTGSLGSTRSSVRVFGSGSEPAVADPPLIATRLGQVVADGEDLVVAAILDAQPYDAVSGGTEPRSLQFWRSTATIDELDRSCQLAPGASCAFTDLTLHPDYPDFSGLDLAAIDLAFAELGGADLSGSNLTGARLWEVTSALGDADLSGANLSGASLQSARLGNLDGADLTGANLDRAAIDSAVDAVFDRAVLRLARVDDATGASFDGAVLRSADLGFSTLPDPQGFGAVDLDGLELELLIADGVASVDVSIAGWDLTGITLAGPSFDGEQRIRIIDADQAVLSDTTFYAADLTALGPDIDLSAVDVWDNSLCPDGLPPDDGPIGTCLRLD